MYTIDQRLEMAFALRRRGYNCAQCVMEAFPDVFQLPSEAVHRLGTAMGGGVGGSGQTCGTMLALAMAEGMRTQGQPADKAPAYRSTASLLSRFKEQNGALSCPELKKTGIPCNELIEQAIRLYNDHLNGCLS